MSSVLLSPCRLSLCFTVSIRWEVLTLVLLNICVLWDVMPCHWACISKDCSAFVFVVKLDPEDVGSTILCQELLAQWHGITLEMA